MVLVVDEVKCWIWEKPRCDPVKVLLTNILVCVIFGFRLRVFEIKSSMNRVLLWSLSIEGNTNAYNVFFVAIFIVCTFLHTQKEIYWTSISVFVFVFALKSIFSSKNISLHYWTLTSIVRNKVTVFGHFLVYQKQLWLHKHWSIGTVCIYFSTFVRFLRLTIILLLILKEEKKKWNVIRKRKNLPIESNENSFNGCNSPTVTLQWKKNQRLAKNSETHKSERNGHRHEHAMEWRKLLQSVYFFLRISILAKDSAFNFISKACRYFRFLSKYISFRLDWWDILRDIERDREREG